MFVTSSASDALEDPGGNFPILLDPILVELEGGRYWVPILPVPLADLLTGRSIVGGSENSSGGSGSGVGSVNSGGRSRGGGGNGDVRSRGGGGNSGGRSRYDGGTALKGKKIGAPGGEREGAGAIQRASSRPSSLVWV